MTASTTDDARVVIHLPGRATNSYFLLGPIHARRLGLYQDPDGCRNQMLLADGADPDNLLVLPNGREFTAYELTTLASKAWKGHAWEVWSDDPGGFPPEDGPCGCCPTNEGGLSA